MKNFTPFSNEAMSLYHTYRLIAITQLIDEYAFKNRAKMVQRLLTLKHLEEEKIGQNKPLGDQYGSQNSLTNGKLLGVNSHITNNGKEVN